MLTPEDRESIESRIRKLDALSKKAGTEAEAALAASRVAELCRKHNLELGSVLVEQTEKKASTGKRAYGGSWEAHRSYLAAACGNLFDVGHFLQNYRGVCDGVKGSYARSHQIIFYGLKANVEAATMTFSYFDESVEAMLWAAVRNREGVFAMPGAGRRQTRSWRLGCAARILEEANNHARLQRAAIEGSTECQALILIGNKLREAFKAELKLGKGSRRESAADSLAYAAGYAAGGRVDLHGARSNRMLKGDK